ncbi:hypothetical protein E6C60_0801 [Paenibacillus algicola]|uniref:SLH domain-containing protein n=1 Tax=Paenibacillus algicola TaxID=2565926 RepID=A0A4P8XGE6_9BACL|nr:S-layer homology domain-containing protein [Paenibacillus algicola]QCT01522.1 hypothetical protein E6C60_0801 [Paenibacillus algicola]
MKQQKWLVWMLISLMVFSMFPSSVSEADSMDNPFLNAVEVEVDRDDHVYVRTHNGQTGFLKKVDRTTSVVTDVYADVAAFTVDGAGNIYIVKETNGDLLKIDTNQHETHIATDIPPKFTGVTGNGVFYYINNNTVHSIDTRESDPQPQPVPEIPADGVRAMSTGGDGNVYVIATGDQNDYNLYTITDMSITHKTLTSSEQFVDFMYPAMTVDKQGQVYITNKDGPPALWKVRNNGFLETAFPERNIPSIEQSVAIDSNNILYVTRWDNQYNSKIVKTIDEQGKVAAYEPHKVPVYDPVAEANNAASYSAMRAVLEHPATGNALDTDIAQFLDESIREVYGFLMKGWTYNNLSDTSKNLIADNLVSFKEYTNYESVDEIRSDFEETLPLMMILFLPIESDDHGIVAASLELSLSMLELVTEEHPLNDIQYKVVAQRLIDNQPYVYEDIIPMNTDVEKDNIIRVFFGSHIPAVAPLGDVLINKGDSVTIDYSNVYPGGILTAVAEDQDLSAVTVSNNTGSAFDIKGLTETRAAAITITYRDTAGHELFSGNMSAGVLAEPVYRIGELADLTAKSVTAGYASGTQETKSAVVRNTGTEALENLKVALTAGDVDDFELTPVEQVLQPGEEGSFTVKAKDGLAAGTYMATITLTADHLSSVTLNVKQVVHPQPAPPAPNPPATLPPVETPPSTSVPSQPGSQAVEVLVNGKVEKAGTLIQSTAGNRSVATVVVDPEKLNEKLAAEGDHAIVTIPVPGKASLVIGELNGQMVKNMEQKQAIIQIQTDKAAYTIPAGQINMDAISNQIGQEVKLSDIKIQISMADAHEDMKQAVQQAAADGGFSIAVPPVDFSIQASYQEKIVDIQSFDTYVERSLKLPAGVDPSQITTGIVIDVDGSIRHVPTKVVEANGGYSVVMNSLTNSTYAVIWHPVEFSDTAEHWSKDAVHDMGSRMIVNGTGKGVFSPNQEITRAELAAIMVQALGLKAEEGSTAFADVEASAWYAGAVEAAFQYGLISGFQDGLFHPTDKVTREQAMVMLSRAMTLTGLYENVEQQHVKEILAHFADGAQIADWAKSQAANALQAGIIHGKGGQKLAPKDAITRAEAAAIVQRLLQESGLI